MNGSHCSKLQSVKRVSVKQLFTNHLGLHVISFTNLQIWKKWCKKEMHVVQTLPSRNPKVNFIRKKENKNKI